MVCPSSDPSNARRGARKRPSVAKRKSGVRPVHDGYSPKPEEISALRKEMGLTQTAFGRLVYRSMRIVQQWEGGLRTCPPDTWEYLSLLHEFPEVERARDLFLKRRHR